MAWQPQSLAEFAQKGLPRRMSWARNATEVIETAALIAIPAKIPVFAFDFQDGIWSLLLLTPLLKIPNEIEIAQSMLFRFDKWGQ